MPAAIHFRSGERAKFPCSIILSRSNHRRISPPIRMHSVFSQNQTRSPKDLACREVGTHSPLSRSQMLRLLLPIAAMNLSSAENWRSKVKCPGRFNKRIRRFESTSHIKMWKSSSLKATLLLSDENATEQTGVLCSGLEQLFACLYIPNADRTIERARDNTSVI